jgi:predicted tellurium resistance membrane protein TerC
MTMPDLMDNLPIVAVLAVVLLLVGGSPIFIARWSKSPSTTPIAILTIVGLVIWPLWIAAFVWSIFTEAKEESEASAGD